MQKKKKKKKKKKKISDDKVLLGQFILTHIWAMSPNFPWNYQKKSGFLMFSGGQQEKIIIGPQVVTFIFYTKLIICKTLS